MSVRKSNGLGLWSYASALATPLLRDKGRSYVELDRRVATSAQPYIPQRRTKGGERMSRCLLLLLLLAAPAFAQTPDVTANCVPGTLSALNFTVAGDSDFKAVMEYGVRHRWFAPDSIDPNGVASCLRSDGGNFFAAQIPNFRPFRNALVVIYDRKSPLHTRLLYQKSRHTTLELTRLTLTVVKKKPDGTATVRVRDAFGKTIRPAPSGPVPQARGLRKFRRFL
jgi:hypothetical protein